MALTKKQLAEVRAALTMGDSRAAKTQDNLTEEDQGSWMLYRRAQKLGYINGQSFEEFLDEVPVAVIRQVFEDMLPPLGNTPASSPPSATSGE